MSSSTITTNAASVTAHVANSLKSTDPSDKDATQINMDTQLEREPWIATITVNSAWLAIHADGKTIWISRHNGSVQFCREWDEVMTGTGQPLKED